MVHSLYSDFLPSGWSSFLILFACFLSTLFVVLCQFFSYIWRLPVSHFSRKRKLHIQRFDWIFLSFKIFFPTFVFSFPFLSFYVPLTLSIKIAMCRHVAHLDYQTEAASLLSSHHNYRDAAKAAILFTFFMFVSFCLGNSSWELITLMILSTQNNDENKVFSLFLVSIALRQIFQSINIYHFQKPQ